MKRHVRLTSLFFTRLLLYFTVIVLPLFHPAIVVPYDKEGWIFWFFLIPVEMFLAFFPAPPRLTFKRWISAGLGFAALTAVIISGFRLSTLIYIGGGMLAFMLTALIFRTRGRGRIFAVLELFYFGIVYFRLLSFSRASEEIALKSHGFTQVVLIVAICAFCLHALVIYLAAFEERLHKKSRRELAFFVSLSVPLILLIALVLPPDFIKHSIVLNELGQPPESKPLSTDSNSENGTPQYGGQNGRGSGKLEGVPRDRWQSLSRKNNKQYAAMLVITKVDTLYAAGTYRSLFDPKKGFTENNDTSLEDNELNTFKTRHLLQTWKWPGRDQYKQTRQAYDVHIFSIAPERYLAYMPFSVEPISLEENAVPFRYSYDAVSGLSLASAPALIKLEDLSPQQKQTLKPYLELQLSPALKQKLADMTEDVRNSKLTPYGKIFVLLQLFRAYQYKAGFSDDTSVAAISKFLFETRSGDCTEFSNAMALLARFVGIPARVVTGYLVASKLQTPAHKRGVHLLRQQLDVLKKYPEQDIFLVTSSHRHSWTQVYMPVYGWIDVESTQFAMPPRQGGDPNDWKVVIPYDERIGREQDALRGNAAYIALLIGIILGALFAAMIVGVYIYRYSLLVYYSLLGRRNTAKGLRALYGLLLMRMAFRGYIIKKPHQTINEYATEYPELAGFAEYYTTLRYKQNIAPQMRERLWNGLRQEYRTLVSGMRGKGVSNSLRSWFSLRGLFYRW